MSRGFGPTFGVGTTDKVTTTLTTGAVTRSYHIWQNRNGYGFAGTGRLFSAGETGPLETEFLFADSGSSTVRYQRNRNINAGQWSINEPAANTWTSIGVSYDSSLTANNPVMYFNGSSVTVTRTSVPSGTVTTVSVAYTAGNASDGTSNNWDGMLTEFAVWDVILTAGEFLALGQGCSALFIRPASLVEYVPMVRANVSRKRGQPTITATLVQDDMPRIIMPTNHLFAKGSQASAAFTGVSSLGASFSRIIRPVAY